MTAHLSEYFEFKNGKKRPLSKGKYPVYGGNGIIDYSCEYLCHSGIVIGRVGVYCGNVFLPQGKYWVSDNAISVQPNSKIDLNFAYYLLKSLRLNERSIGTSQPLLTQEILQKIPVSIPSLDNQRKVGAMLRAIDLKIESNEAINNNLAA